MQSPDAFDIAAVEGLEEETLFHEHLRSVAFMSEYLIENEWSELPLVSDESELYDFYDMISVGSSIRGSLHWDGSFDTSPNILQFFYDLYGFGTDLPFSDILVSYLHEDDARPQNYETYSSDSIADIQYFLESIQRSPALIYLGGFQLSHRGDRLVSSTRRDMMRSLNGICVDVDSVSTGTGKHPMDASVLPALLGRFPSNLLPDYICLTGNGIHLWWVFDKSLQTFGRYNPRREKFANLISASYTLVDGLLEGLPAEVDFACSPLNHGFRAPGSLTKYGDIVRVFCPSGHLFATSSVSPFDLSRYLFEYLGEGYPGGAPLSEDDVRRKSEADLKREADERHKEFLTRPASEKQLLALRSFADHGIFTEEEASVFSELTAARAHEMIDLASKRVERKAVDSQAAQRPSWRTQPHYHVSGSTGGIYRFVLDRIQDVPVGRRYLSLYMLAGLAFYMKDPPVTRDSLRADMESLLTTSWARSGTPLVQRDVEHALLGYNKENYQTRVMISEILGSDPFGPPSKRNGRTRYEHLAQIARPAYAEKSRSDKVSRIKDALLEFPDATKKRISEMTGISYPTVLKYWDESVSAFSNDDCELPRAEDA